MGGLTRQSPLTELPGIGPVKARALAKLGLVNVGDLLAHLPRGYEDRRRSVSIAGAPAGSAVCVEAMVAETPRLSRIRKGLELVKVRAVDHTGTVLVTFFNQGYVKDALRTGESYVFYGAVEGHGAMRAMTNPTFEPADRRRFTGRLMPVYPLTAGISNNLLAGMVLRAVEAGCAVGMEESLPPALRREYGLMEADGACLAVHFPEDMAQMEEARRRYSFEELFYLSVGMAFLKERRVAALGWTVPRRAVEEFTALLPFAPTDAQRRVMEEMAADMASGRPMNRLVQGDVGSGKTAVGAWGAWLAFRDGGQSAMMAPTEILAEQHYRTLSALLAPAGMRVALLTGSMTAAQKKAVRGGLASGEIHLVVGTHAILTKGVAFRRLTLAIVDEQHRFGVDQRAALAAKGEALPPHVLVMSATPIPRTMALLIYGDLDVSVIDQLPPGRTPVQTNIIGESKRERMYGFIERQAALGRQTYIVCPAVEETGEEDGMDLKAVTAYARKLQDEVFPNLRVGLVHGKLKAKEKEGIMSTFAAGELDILVATTVIEVGVDVPNATLMVVENADRFGLSQLHQLRGRVGRGKEQSYCVLVTATKSRETYARLRVLADTTDGFKIAEEDLKQRGPGDFFGSRQHGLPTLKAAALTGDTRLLAQAQSAAGALLAEDKELCKPENRPVLERVRRLFGEQVERFN